MKYRASLQLIFSLLILTAGHQSSQARDVIEWRVDNPFRLFLDPEHTNAQLDLFLSLSREEMRHPVLSMERRLAARQKRSWTEDLFDKTCWETRRNSYRFCHGKGLNYINPQKHKVMMRFSGGYAPTDRCEWTFSKSGKRTIRKSHGLSRVVALCSKEVSFEFPFPLGGRALVSIAGKPRAEKFIKVKDLFIVGIGDSFASGEGNPDDPVQFADDRAANYGFDPDKRAMLGYPTRQGDWKRIGDGPFLREAARWQSRACHRSLYSYQFRTALQLSLEDPHRAVTYAGFACTGSQITVGLFLRYKGNEHDKYPPRLPQLSDLSEELCGKDDSTPMDYTSGYTQIGKLPELKNMVLNKCYKPKRKIDLLMVSIGGNDVGFSSLVANAIMQDKSLLKKVGGWFGSVHGAAESRQALDVLKIRYKALNKAFHYMLRIPWKQSDRILLTAYPRMELQQDGKRLCPSGNAGMSLYPDFSVVKGKLKEAAGFADELFNVMKQSSRRHGWTFVDEHRDQFASHGFCAVNEDKVDTINEHLNLPRFVDNKWTGYKPSKFKPYASRQRWIRTPDDAYMTGHFHASGLISRGLMRGKRSKWFQVVMAGTFSGSFHPTAEGHAVIADAVVRKARKVLKKYEK